MDKVEAREILQKELLHFRALTFEDLKELMGSPQVVERYGDSGVSYIIEIEVFWDNPRDPGGDLRVFGSIDDGGLRSAFSPISSDFVMDSDGSFVGE